LQAREGTLERSGSPLETNIGGCRRRFVQPFLRTALKDYGATFPNQKGQTIPNSTARWAFRYFVGIHLLLIPGQWPLVLNLINELQRLLRLLRTPYEKFYA
jgi:hypothetical protein